MTMVRDIGQIERFPYLAGLPFPAEDVGRLETLQGTVAEPGLFVDAHTGESRFLEANQSVPEGIWIAQRDLDQLRPDGGVIDRDTGFGEGWGKQGAQLGGDRSYPEEDAGGTRRVAHEVPDAASLDDDLPPG